MDAVEEIKARLPIEDVVGGYVELKRGGALLKGLCPFHQEKTPSFTVTPARGTFHCFSCGKHGDVMTFVMEMERLTFPEALKQLAGRAGVQLPERNTEKASLKGKLYEANEGAAAFFRAALDSESGARARQYLEHRHFDRQAVDLFELGFSPSGRDGLTRHLRATGFDDRTLLSAGLAMQDDIGGEARDRFRGRLMFPIRDASGRISGFGGRALGDGQPKYLNSPQTEIFDKSSVLYGVQLAAEGIRAENRAVLVEGYLDAVRAHVVGKSAVVASLGTAVTVPQLTALSRLAGTVIIALDPDPAGQGAAARTALNALAEVTRARGHDRSSAGAVDLRIARLPAGGGDPDELIRTAPERWEEALASAEPAFDFFFEHSMSSLDRASDAWRQQAIDLLLPVIQQFSGSVGWQSIWIERLARETGLDPRTLDRALPKAAPASRGGNGRRPNGKAQEVIGSTTARAITSDPIVNIEGALLALLLTAPILPTEAAEKVQKLEFARREHAIIRDAAIAAHASEEYDYETVRRALPEDLREYADTLHGDPAPAAMEGGLGLAIGYHVARLKYFQVQSEIRATQHTLEGVSLDDRPPAIERLSTLMETRHQVEKELEFMALLVARHGAGAPDYGTIDQISGS